MLVSSKAQNYQNIAQICRTIIHRATSHVFRRRGVGY